MHNNNNEINSSNIIIDKNNNDSALNPENQIFLNNSLNSNFKIKITESVISKKLSEGKNTVLFTKLMKNALNDFTSNNDSNNTINNNNNILNNENIELENLQEINNTNTSPKLISLQNPLFHKNKNVYNVNHIDDLINNNNNNNENNDCIINVNNILQKNSEQASKAENKNSEGKHTLEFLG